MPAIDVIGRTGDSHAKSFDIDVPIEDVEIALTRRERRQVFGKIVVGF